MATINNLIKIENSIFPTDGENYNPMSVYLSNTGDLIVSDGVSLCYKLLIPDQILTTQLKPPSPITISGDSTLTMPSVWEQLYFITKASICAITLPDPTSNDEGKILRFLATTNYAHYVKSQANGFNGSTNKKASMSAGTTPQKSMITLRVFQSKYWINQPESNVTFAAS